MNAQQAVFVVDDDQKVRASLQWLLESLRLRVRTYGSAREFLNEYDPVLSGCLVLDVRMPEISGLQLQAILAEERKCIPTILITGHGDIPMAVRAMRAGAVDFIEKPFNDQELVERIHECLEIDARCRREAETRAKVMARFDSLTLREADVLEGIVSGKSNKAIAAELGISIKTVEVHRARVMSKMAANSVAELTAVCIASGVN